MKQKKNTRGTHIVPLFLSLLLISLLLGGCSKKPDSTASRLIWLNESSQTQEDQLPQGAPKDIVGVWYDLVLDGAPLTAKLRVYQLNLAEGTWTQLKEDALDLKGTEDRVFFLVDRGEALWMTPYEGDQVLASIGYGPENGIRTPPGPNTTWWRIGKTPLALEEENCIAIQSMYPGNPPELLDPHDFFDPEKLKNPEEITAAYALTLTLHREEAELVPSEATEE